MEIGPEQDRLLGDEDKINRISEKSDRPSAEKRRWSIIILVSLVLLGVIIYFLWQYMNSLAVGNVYVLQQPQVRDKEILLEKERFDGKYISFEHDSSYKEKNHKISEDEQSDILESAFFSQQNINAKKIALTVEKLSGGNMENSANYKLRITHPNRYKKSGFYQNGVERIGFSFQDDQTNEKAFFVKKGDILVILAITSPLSSDEKFDSEANDLIKSLTFYFK